MDEGVGLEKVSGSEVRRGQGPTAGARIQNEEQMEWQIVNAM